ncbi:hypothetical protein N7478_006609 [Penicillium angulare]|uniref:uncharacterized protein n=1 Tax=Penicillium angulare TaxID=116970 RepID=UPI0025415955|nr:uncharacterized protein N7478_006609 [Penicillium angulare]KAJ5281237.1 hypothetical protein N7478_006609 [Penicillium angulare]
MENIADSAPSQERENPTSKQDEYAQSTHKGKFRFKSSSRSSKHSSDRKHHKRDRSSESKSKERTYKNRPSHRSRTQSHTQPRPGNSPPRALSPGAAFRESLFDALGDDEGAAYWEGVYGQPIHNYAVPNVEGPTGELEQMDEEEYAAYVRARMWERTREGMLEEQERYREERRRKKARDQESSVRDHERMAFDRAMDDSLRRGAERKSRKKWEEAWETYLARWEEISKIAGSGNSKESSGAESGTSKPLRNLLFWPVESGKRVDVSPDSVQAFMRHAPASTDLLVILKAERVRWHPDKMQHRYSGLGIDDVVMRSVTEVFQIVDRMWNEERERQA